MFRYVKPAAASNACHRVREGGPFVRFAPSQEEVGLWSLRCRREIAVPAVFTTPSLSMMNDRGLFFSAEYADAIRSGSVFRHKIHILQTRMWHEDLLLDEPGSVEVVVAESARRDESPLRKANCSENTGLAPERYEDGQAWTCGS